MKHHNPKPSHTPGPWVAIQTNLVTTERAWQSQGLGELKYAFQATVSLHGGEGQAKANATLIAAAPCLASFVAEFLECGPNAGHNQELIAEARRLMDVIRGDT